MEKDIFNLKNRKRFRSFINIDSETGCWLWQGTLIKGYGSFYLPERQQSVYAHRWSWELLNGPIPRGYELHHDKCDKACVNSKHLRLLTHLEHMRLHARSGIWDGAKNSQAKRTTVQVLTIKFLNGFLGFKAKHISKVMKIPERSIYSIIARDSWKSIELPENFGDEAK